MGPRRDDKTPFADASGRFLASRHGMWLFLLSLAVLFAATVIGWFIIRYQLRTDWPTDVPPLPDLLWFSTLLIILSSLTMWLGERALQRRTLKPLRNWLTITTILAIGFLACQTIAWFTWHDDIADLWPRSDTTRFALTGFYVMTMLHAAHVIGGIIPLVFITTHLTRATNPADHQTGLHLTAMYLHFLLAVWICLFAILIIS